jgi:hypothetical protein
LKSDHREIIGMAGVGLVAAGVGAIYLPAGFIVLGGFLIAAAILARPEKKDK